MLFQPASNLWVPGLMPQFGRGRDSGGGGSIAFLNAVASGTGSTGTTSGSIDTSGADFLILAACYFTLGGTLTVSDSKSNTWTQLAESVGGTYCGIRLFYAENAIVGAGHTFSATGTDTFASLSAAAFSGVDLSGSFDQQNGFGNVSTDTIQPGSITPSSNNSLVVTGLNHNDNGATASVDSGFSISAQVSPASSAYFGCALAYKIQGAAAAVNPTWTVSSFDAQGIAARIASFLD